MSVELYTKICAWFLNWETPADVFSHCFLVFYGILHVVQTQPSSILPTFPVHMKMSKTRNDAKCLSYATIQLTHLFVPYLHLVCTCLPALTL